ncbi:hypothetical protein [Roseobacter sp. HKCCA0434]|uniref:hypothetical protein n=1 Tax=Roseobacter sp. HKCCA0434 TaxID=3079297 RepID=UPI002905E5C2|nr:hypothetical protein [Roseobacter sp. HKCCA0434]
MFEYEISPESGALQALEECVSQLARVETEPVAWRWAITSACDAVNAALVAHHTGTRGIGAYGNAAKHAELQDRLSDLHVAARASEQQDDPAFPEREETKLVREELKLSMRVHSLLDMLTSVALHSEPEGADHDGPRTRKREAGSFDTAGAKVDVSPEMTEAITYLQSLRNNLVHVKPISWSIDMRGIPARLMEVAKFLSLMDVSSWAFRHYSPAERKRFGIAVRELLASASALDRRVQATE